MPNKDKVATITKAQVKEIAERKMPDLTANTIEAAMSQVAGTCRSMGIVVVDLFHLTRGTPAQGRAS